MAAFCAAATSTESATWDGEWQGDCCTMTVAGSTGGWAGDEIVTWACTAGMAWMDTVVGDGELTEAGDEATAGDETIGGAVIVMTGEAVEGVALDF